MNNIIFLFVLYGLGSCKKGNIPFLFEKFQNYSRFWDKFCTIEWNECYRIKPWRIKKIAVNVLIATVQLLIYDVTESNLE